MIEKELVIEPGMLRHRVDILQEVAPQDSTGDPVPTWHVVDTRRCSIKPLVGRELERAKQIKAETDHLLTFRYFALTPEHKIRYGQRIFEITAVVNVWERNRKLLVFCTEAKEQIEIVELSEGGAVGE